MYKLYKFIEIKNSKIKIFLNTYQFCNISSSVCKYFIQIRSIMQRIQQVKMAHWPISLWYIFTFLLFHKFYSMYSFLKFTTHGDSTSTIVNDPRKVKLIRCGSNLHIHEVPKSSSHNVQVWRRCYLPVECCTLMNSNDPLMHTLYWRYNCVSSNVNIHNVKYEYSQCQVWIFTISGMNIHEVHPVASASADDPMNNDCLLASVQN